jgi:hypothetical protein
MKRLFEYIVTIVFLFLLFGGILADLLIDKKLPILGFIVGFELGVAMIIMFFVIYNWVRKTFKSN